MSNRMRGACALALLLLGGTLTAGADQVDRTPGRQYAAGGFQSFLLGENWRSLWTTPIRVPVLDLSRFAGGLEPTKRGGGRQTKSLRFEGADGRKYVFRSLDKDPVEVLRKDLRDTWVADLFQDQVSSQHPAGGVVAAALLGAAGVLHATPALVVMPDDRRLGEFRRDFAGMLGTIEERPDDPEKGRRGFAGSLEVVDTEELLKRLSRSAADRVDARAYLRARLMDFYLGDWDRHDDNWSWARFDVGGVHVWRPIPKDRDQVFARLDGILPSITAGSKRPVVVFEETYPSVLRLAWSARRLDRRILPALERRDWSEVADDVRSRLSDSVIETAVRRMPGAYSRHGVELARILRARRERLPETAQAFYGHLAGDVDVHATAAAERAVIDRHEDGALLVELTAPGDGEPYFRRLFRPEETREVRLWLGDGKDAVEERGVRTGLRVRVVTRNGAHGLEGLAASTRCYTEPEGASLAGCTALVPLPKEEGSAIVEPLPAPPRDWGRERHVSPGIGYLPERGVGVSAQLTGVRYGFRRRPHAAKQSLRGTLWIGSDRWGVEYTGDFRRIARASRFGAVARVTNAELLRFYGFGNDSVENDAASELRQTVYALEPSFIVPFGSVDVTVGPRFKRSDTPLRAGTILARRRPLGTGTFDQLGAGLEVVADTRDEKGAATRGVLFAAGATGYPDVLDVGEPFAEAHGALSTYLTAPFPMRPTLALRIGGKRVLGTFPFHEAAYVGGHATLRGFAEQRFAGNAFAFGNAELRLSLKGLLRRFPGDFGVFGGLDGGRVWFENASPRGWHSSWGGGLWVAPFNRGKAYTLSVTRSGERTVVAFGGFLF
jgi:hypothetical protein